MNRYSAVYLLVLGALAVTLGSRQASSQQNPLEVSQPLAAYKPSWQVGQSWIVETRTPLLQIGRELDQAKSEAILRWKFTVEGTAELDNEKCYVLSARPQAAQSENLELRLWISTDRLLLRRWEASVIASGRPVRTGETLVAKESPNYPAWVPLTVLPVAFPCWEEVPVKHVHSYRYEVVPGHAEAKTPADVAFVVPVEQESDSPEERFTKSVLGLPADHPSPAGVVKIDVRSPIGHCQQLWQAGQPWPVWATNGISVSRLVTAD
ncbi:MAG: outer membrane lipoprotein-sorting protein [Thermoguttaceae bacterium]|nr:outer membrane lipoprotein-sorting protein [Thermoguttaceae bacterium]MDW8079805.1 hypothetical protein [Thermoguttaceae bacterium]